MPELFIITGSNGAGKSTIGPKFLPQYIQDSCKIFDGDKLFIQKRNELWQTIKAPKEVRKLAYEFTVETFEQQVSEALASRSNYAYEGHFTNDDTWDIPRKFKSQGYIVHLLFLGLNNPDISQQRVIERSRDGGHWVDRATIEDNYYGNLEKLEQHIDAVHNIQIVDTTENYFALAYFVNGEAISAIPYSKLPEWFIKYLPMLSKKIREVETKAQH